MKDHTSREQWLLLLTWLLLGGTCVMTYLTVAKELVLYQNNTSVWTLWIYKIATHHYYALLAMHFLALLVITLLALKGNWFSPILKVVWVVFLLNVLIFSSNNLLNLLEGQPLHRRHQGIGW